MGEGQPFLRLDSGEMQGTALQCPRCGDYYTHLDSVEVYSASGQAVTVSTVGQGDYPDLSVLLKAPIPVGGDSRHTITIVGTCELGCEFRIQLVQKQGNTIASIDGRDA